MTDPFLFDPHAPRERDPNFSTRPPKHDGPGLTEGDQRRLNTLLSRVHGLMCDGEWRTLREIADACGGSEASVSARLRDLRRDKWQAIYGACVVDKERVTDGVWRYRLGVI